MSEQEQDAVIGRTLRELADAKRKLTAMEAERERYEAAFKMLTSGLSYNVDPNFNAAVVARNVSHEPLSRFDFSKLVDFFREYSETRVAVQRGEKTMRDMGV
jgi:hypothetical protein